MTTDEKLERVKHGLTLALEAKKWTYRKEEIGFIEAGQHIRALNVILWQVPSMAIAITGGLWYGISLFDNSLVKSVVLGFASTVDLITLFIIWRLRSVMQGYISIQQSILPQPKIFGKYVVISCWTTILSTAAIIGILGACNPQLFVRETVKPPPAITSCETAFALNVSVDEHAHSIKKPLKHAGIKQCQ